ncbi:hypothetical protein F5887DRAFT_125340 [Amanita rubescens]|nr:hypothetical protein F5887DRAFT_125340 [Amanita rubescens]
MAVKDCRSFARLTAAIACATSLFGFAILIVAATIIVVTHNKAPLNPDAYAYLPTPCYTELECDIVTNPIVNLHLLVVLLGLFYVLVILISGLTFNLRFLNFVTLGMCCALVLLLRALFFRYGLTLLAVLDLQEPVTRDRALKYVVNSGFIYFLALSMTFWLSATLLGGGIILFVLSQ